MLKPGCSLVIPSVNCKVIGEADKSDEESGDDKDEDDQNQDNEDESGDEED